MAAIKIYVAIVLHARNDPADAVTDYQGSAALSYDQLTELTDLSRAMVAQGVRLLERFHMIRVERGARRAPSRYFLNGYGSKDGWTRIPNKRIFKQTDGARIGLLHELSCRRQCDLNALKVYLLLASFRDNRSRSAMIGYEKIEGYTGLTSTKIRQAISVLIEHGLIAVDREKNPDPDNKQNHPNRYEILGL